MGGAFDSTGSCLYLTGNLPQQTAIQTSMLSTFKLKKLHIRGFINIIIRFVIHLWLSQALIRKI